MPTHNGTGPDLLELRFTRIEADEKTGEPRTYTKKSKRADLVGTAEAAHMLGVERPRIGRWIAKGQMPMPAVWPAAGPMFWRIDIEAMVEDVEARRRAPAATTD
jgi:hypothetical protein